MVNGLRFCLLATFGGLTLVPGSPLFGRFAVTVPVFFAFIAALEFGYAKWSGADRLRRAKQRYRDHDLDGAAAELDAVLALNRQAWVGSAAAGLKAALEIERGQFAEASMHSRLSRELFDDREAKATHLALEGFISHLLGQPREALSRLDSAESLARSKPLTGLIALVRAALFLFHEQDHRKALIHLDRAAGAPGHPLVARHLNLLTALALAESGRRDDARLLLIECRRDLPLRTFVEARIIHLGGDLLRAVLAYEAALEALDEAYLLYRSVTKYHLGTARMELGQIRDGSRALKQALRSNLPDPYRRRVPRRLPEPTTADEG